MNDKDNKLIALFMGLEEDGVDGYLVDMDKDYGYQVIHESCFLYDSSWDWLMPVVEKIESLGYWVNRNDGDVTISNKSDMVVITPMSSGGIDMMYKAVVEFIKEQNDGR